MFFPSYIAELLTAIRLRAVRGKYLIENFVTIIFKRHRKKLLFPTRHLGLVKEKRDPSPHILRMSKQFLKLQLNSAYLIRYGKAAVL
jgi:hypothetical protein